MKLKYRFFGVFTLFVLGIILVATSVISDAASFTGVSYGTNYVNPAGYQTSYQTYYSQQDLSTYWPILDNQTMCQGQQDLLLQVAPGGCQPTVVRSDLLAQQNVPVFCQIDAVKLNPLIDISSINSIRFTQQYPAGVAGIGFHPANAALRTTDALLGSPVLSNIGYVVVILKQNPNESSLPDSITTNLSGYVTYDAGNALGIGSSEFILSPISDQQWSNSANRDSFWQGRYYIRLESADPNYATVSIYQGDNKVSTVKAPTGQLSDKLYLPGFYCQASLQVEYDGFVESQNKARLQIDGDTVDVYQGSQILNGACSVTAINVGNLQVGQQVSYNNGMTQQIATISGVNSNLGSYGYGGTYTYSIRTSDGKTLSNINPSQLTSSGSNFGSVTINCGSLFSGGSVTLYRNPIANTNNLGTTSGAANNVLIYGAVSNGGGTYSFPDIIVGKFSLGSIVFFGGSSLSVQSDGSLKDGSGNSYWDIPGVAGAQKDGQKVSVTVKGQDATLTVRGGILYDDFNNAYVPVAETQGIKDYAGNFAQLTSSTSSQSSSSTQGTSSNLKDKIQSSSVVESAVSDAIKSYKDVANQYPQENANPDVSTSASPTYGETALSAAINLADKYGKVGTEADLINQFIKLYPSSSLINSYNQRLQSIYTIDSSLASSVVYLNNKYHTINLVDLQSPTNKAGANFTIGNSLSVTTLDLHGNSKSLPSVNNQNNQPVSAGTISLYSLTASSAVVSATCAQNIVIGNNIQTGNSIQSFTFTLGQNGQTTQQICGVPVTINAINMEQLADVKLIPTADNTQSNVNFSVGIGIEKRAIQLNPQKTQEMIANINQSIAKWQSISNNLGKVVTGLKAACFATSAVLTVKSFMNGINGEGIARQNVMSGTNGWNVKCQQMVAQGQYKDLNTCFNANSNEIESEVKTEANAVNKINSDMESIPSCQSQSTNVLSSLFGSSSTIDRTACANAFYDHIKSTYGSQTINLAGSQIRSGDVISYNGQQITVKSANINSDGTYNIIDSNGKAYLNVKGSDLSTTIGNMLSLSPGEGYGNGTYTLDQLKNIELAVEGQASNNNSLLQTVYQQISNNKNIYDQITKAQSYTSQGLANPINAGTRGQQVTYADMAPPSSLKISGLTFSSSIMETVTIPVGSSTVINTGGNNPANGGIFIGKSSIIPLGTYVAGLVQPDPTKNVYYIRELHRINDNGVVEDKTSSGSSVVDVTNADFINQFTNSLGLTGGISPQSQISYHNKYLNPQVQYFETDPYKGMPAIVPFDIQNGWYAATKQTLPAFGSQGTFDASGRVSSFWLCNVGPNGINQFNEGLGDDTCEQINLNTGQSISQFPNLNAQQAQAIVAKAIQALNDAANQYGSGQGAVKIIGLDTPLQRGAPATNLPTTQCTDFMSAKDCDILFNVCDPVICPSSRCNLGGAYPVADVLQTGIIGSLTLCLPNFGNPANGGVAIPVCLSGLNAGIQNYISVLQASRDCLQQNLNTGQYVGICDEITSIYTCEFFWSQVAPFANLLLPRIIDLAYTGGQARGGGEYMTVMGAWQNMQNEINYFTNIYSVNSLTAFKTQNIEEAGTTFCKAFVSASAPTSIKSLIQPDSPPQFSAWFSTQPFTTATVPATSQYNVYYHIFGGNDAGVYYGVYLKSSSTSSYYYISPILTVASGFIAQGQYADQTKDFTAPTGYKQLCVDVNGQEQCGFGQVSTSFAVNYLSDSYAASEINQTNINSEQACISGSANAGALLTNPNLQAGATSAVLPQIYNNGITRICATQNPGSTTDPTRYAAVGNCGDPSITCWLDTNSVNNAISQSDVGLKNATLSDIQNLQQQAILAQTNLSSDQLSSSLDTIKGEVDSITNTISSSTDIANLQVNVANELLKIDNTFGVNLENLILNNQKAETLYLKARLKGSLADAYYYVQQSNTNAQQTTSSIPAAQTTLPTPGSTNAPLNSILQLPNTGSSGTATTIYFTFDSGSNAWTWSLEPNGPWMSLSQLQYSDVTSLHDGETPSSANLAVITSLNGMNQVSGDNYLAGQSGAGLYSPGNLSSSATSSSSTATTTIPTPNLNTIPIVTSASLDASTYDPSKTINILINAKKSGIYLLNNKVMYTESFLGLDYLYPDKQIGVVNNKVITLLSSASNDIGNDEYTILNNDQIQADRTDGLPIVLTQKPAA